MKAYKESETHYYKYEYSTFTQPVLTSNTSNLNFVVSGTNGDSNWRVFDNNESTGYSRYSSYGRPDFTSNITLSAPACFTGFTVKQRKDGDDNHSGHYFILYGSNDGTNYTQLVSTGVQGANTYTTSFANTNYYGFYRFYASPLGGYNEDEIDIRDVSFVGENRSVTEGTAEDYDYFIEGGKTYVVKEENVRKYYKYGNIPNANTVGSPTVNNGVASGFSDGNNFTFSEPLNFNNQEWEMVFKVTTGSNTQTQSSITGNYGNAYQNSPEITVINNKFRMGIPKDGSTTLLVDNILGSYTVLANTTYWIKLYWTGTAYKLDYSLDGQNWTNDITVNNSTAMYGAATQGATLGCNYSDTNTSHRYPWLGSIDFNESYIKVNGAFWWHGTKVEEATAEDYDFYEDVDIYKALKTYEKGQYYGN